jgi:hypothetical protein
MGTQGRVYQFDTNLWSDDSAPIYQQVTFRATDFGDCGIGKDLNEIFVDVGTDTWEQGTQEAFTVEYSVGLREAWNACTPATLKGPVRDDALTSEVLGQRSIWRYACPAKRFQTIQIRATLEADQPLKISKVAYKIRADRERSTVEASD